MWYLAQQILLWLALVFVAGLAAGWMIWRWGRRTVDQNEFQHDAEHMRRIEAERAELEIDRQRLAADLDERTRRIAELESASVRTHRTDTENSADNSDLFASGGAHLFAASADTDMQASEVTDALSLSDLPPPPMPIAPPIKVPTAGDDLGVVDVANPGVPTFSFSDGTGFEEDSIDDLRTRLAAAEQEAARVADLEARIEEMRTGPGPNALHAPDSTQSARVADLETEVADLRRRLNLTSPLESRLADLEVEAGRVAGLEAQLEALRLEHATLIESSNVSAISVDASSSSDTDLGLVVDNRDSDASIELVDDSAQRIADAERELEQVRAEADREMAQLRSQVAELQADAARVADLDVGAEAASVDTTIQAAAAQIDVADGGLSAADADELRSEIARLRVDAERLSGLEAEAVELRELAGRLPEIERRASELEATLAEVRTERDDLRGEVERSQAAAATAESRAGALASELGSAQGELAGLQASLDKMELASDADVADKEATAQRMRSLEEQVGLLRAEHKAAVERATAAEQAATQAQAQADEADRQTLAQRDAAAEAVGQASDSAAEVEELRAQLETSTADSDRLAMMEAQIVGLRADADSVIALQAENASLQGQIADLAAIGADRDAARKELARLRLTAGEAESKLVASRLLVARAEADRDEAKTDADQANEIAGDALALQRKLDKADKKIASLDASLVALRQAEAQAREAHKVARAQARKAASAASKCEADLKRAQAQLNSIGQTKEPRAVKAQAPTKKAVAKKTPVKKPPAKKSATPRRQRDDLKLISGVGPKLERLLNNQGITTFEQIASFSKSDIVKIDEKLENFRGRIERDNWKKQARDLAKARDRANRS